MKALLNARTAKVVVDVWEGEVDVMVDASVAKKDGGEQ